MPKVKVQPKRRIKSLYVTALFDGVEIQVPDPKMTAQRVASKLRSKLIKQMRAGTDADGTRHTVKLSTIMRRRRDSRPPEKPRSARFAQKFRKGPSHGSEGAYVSSGEMTKTIRIMGKRQTDKRKARVTMKLSKERWFVPQVLRRMIIGVTDADVEAITKEIVDKAIATEKA